MIWLCPVSICEDTTTVIIWPCPFSTKPGYRSQSMYNFTLIYSSILFTTTSICCVTKGQKKQYKYCSTTVQHMIFFNRLHEGSFLYFKCFCGLNKLLINLPNHTMTKGFFFIRWQRWKLNEGKEDGVNTYRFLNFLCHCWVIIPFFFHFEGIYNRFNGDSLKIKTDLNQLVSSAIHPHIHL